MKRLALAVLAAGLFVGPAAQADNTLKIVTAVRTSSPPRLDGVVDDPQWQTAPAVMDFLQYEPVEGALPSEQTSVRILYDDHALYVGVICYDAKPEGVTRQLIRRDRSTEADRFTIQIDSYHDHQTAFVFSTNVSGVKSDGVLSQDGNAYDISWDAVWDVNTRVFRDGWSAEFEIPFNALRFAEVENEKYEWGINFRRYVSRKKETDEWLMVPHNEMLKISRWGHLDGITNITPPLHLDLQPYVSSSGNWHASGTPWSSPRTQTTLAGMDVKFGLARNFTLDASIHPDFGQVEVDQAVLNLTVFEPYYPEKRPFFIEGSQMFSFGTSVDNTPLSLFFSRRIGKRPSGSYGVVPLPGEQIKENPLVTPILGAAKISGRTNSGFSLGVLSAATSETEAQLLSPSGTVSSLRTEPRGLYHAARFKQDFDGNSWVGGLMTVASREFVLPAVSGGIDWNLRMGEGAFTLDGYVAGARSSRQEDRDGMAGRLLLSRIAADHWFWTGSYDFYSRMFNINDLGFFAQPHDHGGYFQIIYRENAGTGVFRRYAVSLVPEARWNWDGVLTRAMVEASCSGELMNFWRPTIIADFMMPSYDDAERGIIGIYQKPLAGSLRLQLSSDERAAISGTLTGGVELNDRSKQSYLASLMLTIRPTSWVELTPSLYYQVSRHEETGVLSGYGVASVARDGRMWSLFGDRNVDEVDIAFRGIFTFTRSLSLQFFTQALLGRGTYANFRRLTTPQSFIPDEEPGRNFDFNEVTLNANMLLRWEYLPGSTVYLVWTQGRYEDSGVYGTRFGQRFTDMWALPHDDVVLLKMTYWFSL